MRCSPSCREKRHLTAGSLQHEAFIFRRCSPVPEETPQEIQSSRLFYYRNAARRMMHRFSRLLRTQLFSNIMSCEKIIADGATLLLQLMKLNMSAKII